MTSKPNSIPKTTPEPSKHSSTKSTSKKPNSPWPWSASNNNPAPDLSPSIESGHESKSARFRTKWQSKFKDLYGDTDDDDIFAAPAPMPTQDKVSESEIRDVGKAEIEVEEGWDSLKAKAETGSKDEAKADTDDSGWSSSNHRKETDVDREKDSRSTCSDVPSEDSSQSKDDSGAWTTPLRISSKISKITGGFNQENGFKSPAKATPYRRDMPRSSALQKWRDLEAKNTGSPEPRPLRRNSKRRVSGDADPFRGAAERSSEDSSVCDSVSESGSEFSFSSRTAEVPSSRPPEVPSSRPAEVPRIKPEKASSTSAEESSITTKEIRPGKEYPAALTPTKKTETRNLQMIPGSRVVAANKAKGKCDC